MASQFFSDSQSPSAGSNAVRRKHSEPLAGSTVNASRLTVVADTLGCGESRRVHTPPPALRRKPDPVWLKWPKMFWRWVRDLEHLPTTLPPLSGLAGVKAQFERALWDLQSAQADEVRDNIAMSRSLRELWHLRPAVFRVVALHRGQMDAQKRLDALDMVFPIRPQEITNSDPSRSVKSTTW